MGRVTKEIECLCNLILLNKNLKNLERDNYFIRMDGRLTNDLWIYGPPDEEGYRVLILSMHYNEIQVDTNEKEAFKVLKQIIPCVE